MSEYGRSLINKGTKAKIKHKFSTQHNFFLRSQVIETKIDHIAL